MEKQWESKQDLPPQSRSACLLALSVYFFVVFRSGLILWQIFLRALFFLYHKAMLLFISSFDIKRRAPCLPCQEVSYVTKEAYYLKTRMARKVICSSTPGPVPILLYPHGLFTVWHGWTTGRFYKVHARIHYKDLDREGKMRTVGFHASCWRLWLISYLVEWMQLQFEIWFLRLRCLDRLYQRPHLHDHPSTWLMGKTAVDFPPSCDSCNTVCSSSRGFLDRFVAGSFVC